MVKVRRISTGLYDPKTFAPICSVQLDFEVELMEGDVHHHETQEEQDRRFGQMVREAIEMHKL